MDQKLIKRAQKGDADAVEELLSSCEDLIIRVCWHYLQNKEDTEDAVIETEANLWSGLGSYTRNESFEGFVATIARNVCLSMLKKRSTQTRGGGKVIISRDAMRVSDDSDQGIDVPDPTADVEDEVIRKEEIELMRRCLSALPEDQYMALYLTQIQGIKYAQAAEILDISEGTVKSQVNRARDKLKRMWYELNLDSDDLIQQSKDNKPGRRTKG